MATTEQQTFYDQHPFDWVPADASQDLSLPLRPARARGFDRNSRPGISGAGRRLRPRPCSRLSRSPRPSLHRPRSQPRFARLAIQRYGRPGVVGDNLHLPFADATADVVISDGVIHHTENPHAAFAENFRVLKPGGRMYLAVYKPSGRYPAALPFSWRVDSRRPAPRLVQAFRRFVFPRTIFPGAFPSLRRQPHLGAALAISFFDYFVTPHVAFLPAQHRRSLVRRRRRLASSIIDENRGQNVHSFLVLKDARCARTSAASSCLGLQNRGPRGETGNRMSDEHVLNSVSDYHASGHPARLSNSPRPRAGLLPVRGQVESQPSPVSSRCGTSSVSLLILAICAAIYSVGWEFSTRRYLKGFSDAIVPATAPGDEKIQAVLNWMAHGPTRFPYGPSPDLPDRDPTDTLNYDALLQVCGTATNAFINLIAPETCRAPPASR